jgi:hypothetical protein
MKSIFDPDSVNEINDRIHSLSAKHTAQWGKMDVFQMLKHCTLCEDMLHGQIKINRVFIGRIIGPTLLKKVLKDKSPFGKNSPTAPVLITTNLSGDIEQQKKEWINRIAQYSNFTNTSFVHPFFGAMSKEQIGIFVYKHADHHLRQFGA